MLLLLYFYNQPATTEIYTLSLHDALPIYKALEATLERARSYGAIARDALAIFPDSAEKSRARRERLPRSEEHTSELQSHSDLVCRLLLEKKKRCNTRILQ